LWDKDELNEKVWPRFEDGRATISIVTRDGKSASVSGWIFVPCGALAELLSGDKGKAISHTTVSGEHQCCKWLVGLMKNGKQLRTKRDAKQEALDKFDVSRKGFDRAWKAALKQSSDPHGWSRGGRPRKAG
jgi:invasion protein IalB